jgi:hypothetical protein
VRIHFDLFITKDSLNSSYFLLLFYASRGNLSH